MARFPYSSGASYFSGWIGVFAVFNDEGKWKGKTKALGQPEYDSMDSEEEPVWKGPILDTEDEVIKLEYPGMSFDDIPSGTISVPLAIEDNGEETECIFFAGQMAADVNEAEDTIQM